MDLHWSLLRTGRLRHEFVDDILASRRHFAEMWVPCAEDSLFLLLVHPAFAKHLSGWDMGMHRVVDIALWLETQETQWPVVEQRLSVCGVRTAAWATLRWLQLLMPSMKHLRSRKCWALFSPAPHVARGSIRG